MLRKPQTASHDRRAARRLKTTQHHSADQGPCYRRRIGDARSTSSGFSAHPSHFRGNDMQDAKPEQEGCKQESTMRANPNADHREQFNVAAANDSLAVKPKQYGKYDKSQYDIG